MRVLLKILMLSILFLSFYNGLQAQSENSKSSFDLDSTEIVKMKEFFSDLDLDRGKMIKIKKMIPDLDTVKMRKIKGIVPMLDYYDDRAIKEKKKELAPDYIPEYGEPGWGYFRPRLDTVIVKGSEVPWRFKFNKGVTYVELQGVGRANKKDIQAGKWNITTKPQRSTTYNIKIIGSLVNISMSRKVIVVESESEAKKVRDEMEKKREEDRKNPHKIIRIQPSLYDRR